MQIANNQQLSIQPHYWHIFDQTLCDFKFSILRAPFVKNYSFFSRQPQTIHDNFLTIYFLSLIVVHCPDCRSKNEYLSFTTTSDNLRQLFDNIFSKIVGYCPDCRFKKEYLSFTTTSDNMRQPFDNYFCFKLSFVVPIVVKKAFPI